jgi:hypothetical protein
MIGDIVSNIAIVDSRLIIAKKLHVLAALEIEQHRKQATETNLRMQGDSHGTLADNTAKTIDTLMLTSYSSQVLSFSFQFKVPVVSNRPLSTREVLCQPLEAHGEERQHTIFSFLP